MRSIIASAEYVQGSATFAGAKGDYESRRCWARQSSGTYGTALLTSGDYAS